MACRTWDMMIGWIVVALLCHPAAAAENPLEGDLGDLRVGVTVEDLPADG